MPKFRIIVEDSVVHLRYRDFEAVSMEDAKAQAEEEEWVEPQWLYFDSYTHCEIRDDLSEERRDL